MSAADLKPDDRVTVSYEATVVIVGTFGTTVTVVDERGHEHIVAASTVTKLPDPEPEWQPGDVVRYSIGSQRFAALFTIDRVWVDVDRDTISPSSMSAYWRAGVVEIVHRAGGAA